MNEQLKIIISAQIDKLKQNVDKAKQEIKGFKERVADASKNVDENFKKMGSSISNGLKTAGAAIAGAATALLALGASTSEYRKLQGNLVSAFEDGGKSAETAKNTYNDLFRVLGDGGKATEAAQHLAKLSVGQKELSEYTEICKGVYAQFSDSLAIEGLTEAINHTVNLGEVQGTLADALEWSGISTDEFNEKLAKCTTQAQREKLIRETLNGLYSESAKKYEKNNAQILAQNEANAKFQESTAKVGKALAPVLTALTTLGADVLTAISPYIQSFAENYLPAIKEALGGVAPLLESTLGFMSEHKTILAVMAGIIGGVVAAIGLYNAVAAIKAVMDAMEVATVWGLVSAYAAQAAAMITALAPYLAIVAAIALLVAGFLWLWDNCEGFRNFWIGLWENLKQLFANFVESLKPLISAIVGAFVEAWALIQVVWDIVKPYFEGIWNAIKAVFSMVGSILGGYFKSAWEIIKSVWSVAVSYFTAIWNTIKGVFSVVKNVLSGNFKGAWEAIKSIFSGWGSFFKSLWSAVKSIFGNVAQAIGNAISSTVKGAVNAVLSTAAGIINGFISAINVAIGIINAIPGVNIKKLGKLNVPKMAEGGIVDSATLAVIGEQGKEAVVPLENNTEWMDVLSSKLIERMNGGNKPIVLEVDGKVFAQISTECINRQTRQTGHLALEIV